MRAEIEREWGHSIPPTYHERVNARTVEAYATDLTIVPGIQDAFDAITVPVCVASSSHPESSTSA